MSDRDPFALGGRHTAERGNENIVDRQAEAFLPYLDAEPTLGPMARELFEVEEAQGNMKGGPLGDPLLWAELEERFKAVFPAVCSAPAETIGGLAWRLGQIKSSLADDDLPEYITELIQTGLDDALRLAGRAPRLSFEQERTLRRLLGAMWYAGNTEGTVTMVLTMTQPALREYFKIVDALSFGDIEPLVSTQEDERKENETLARWVAELNTSGAEPSRGPVEQPDGTRGVYREEPVR